MNLKLEKDATEIKRLRALNDTLEKEMEKCRGELQSVQTRRKMDKAEIAALSAKLEESCADIDASSIGVLCVCVCVCDLCVRASVRVCVRGAKWIRLRLLP